MVDPAALADTRRSLHAVAEWVLAPARQQVDGRIGLRATTGGFGSPEANVRVDGLDLVVAGERRPLTTLAAAAAFAGVPRKQAPGVYETATRWAGEELLPLDAAAAEALADWFALGAQVLDELRWQRDDASGLTLWPEHFDLALTVADAVNLGASPGDDEHELPYLYVGPWESRTGPFWNEPFGASLAYDDVDGPATALDFLREGLEQLGV